MADERRDMLSSLPSYLLITIISRLPFKDAVRTSVLSKRWLNLWCESKSFELKERDFVDFSKPIENRMVRRELFIRFLCVWFVRFFGKEMDTFELTFSRPESFRREFLKILKSVLEKRIKNLVLDFSDPMWQSDDDHEDHYIETWLPACVYHQNSFESMKLYGCRFCPLGFVDLRSLKSLSIGWTELRSMRSVLSTCPLLENLSLKNVWDLESLEIKAGENDKLRELVIENCSFIYRVFNFDAPRMKIFKYSGDIGHFHFDRVDRIIDEAHLDFRSATEFAERGEDLYNLLHGLTSVRTLSVCPYLLQVIPSGPIRADRMQQSLEVRHLIIKTAMQSNEFLGIRFMIQSCWNLETLTFKLIPPRLLEDYSPPFRFDHRTFWDNSPEWPECLKRSLKVVEVKRFRGYFSEVKMMQYLIFYGRMMQRVDLYVSPDLSPDRRQVAFKGVKVIQECALNFSTNLEVNVLV